MSYDFNKDDLEEELETQKEEIRRIDDFVASLDNIKKWMDDTIGGAVPEKDDVIAEACLLNLKKYLLELSLYRRDRRNELIDELLKL